MNETEMLQQAEQAIKQGDVTTAGKLLKKILRENSQNDVAWLMVATITKNPDKKAEYLNRALQINPANEVARQELVELESAFHTKPKSVENSKKASAQPKATNHNSNQNKWILGLVTLNTLMVLGSCIIMGLVLANSYLLQTRIQSLQKQVEQTIGMLPVQSTVKPGETENIQPEIIDAPIDSGSNQTDSDESEMQAIGETPDQSTEEAGSQTSSEISGTVTKTPNPIIDAVVAGGGEYIILRMETIPGLAIYDTTEKKIVNTFRLASDNFLYTAGGNIVLVYYPENNLLQTWSLEAFEKLKTKPNPNGAIITRMTMGHSNDNRALVRFATGTEALDHAGMYLLDIENLQEIPRAEDAKLTTGHNSSYRDFVHQRADGSMRIVSEWASSHSPSGLGLFLLSDDSWTTAYDHDSVGYIAVGDDGLIYTQNGSIYNSQLTQIGDLRGLRLIPGIGGTLFLGISSDGSMQVYTSGSTTPIGPGGNFPGLENEDNLRAISGAWAKGPYVFDRHIVFDPTHGYMALIPPENDRIIQRDFDLEQLLEKAGVDYLVVISTPNINVTPGETWQYNIETLSNNDEIKFSLEFGPEGMKIGNDGTLTWTIPADHAGGAEKVVVLVENGNGDSTYHNFELQVKPLP